MTLSQPTDLNASRSWSELLTPAAMVRIAVVTALLFVAYWGTIRYTLVARWISDGNWSHGWLIPVFSFYFLVTRRDALLRAGVRANYFGAALLVLSLAAYFYFSWRLPMAYPRGLTIVGAIFGLTLLMAGWPVMRIAWFPILFLLFAIPLPSRIYVALTLPLREFASTAAAALMPLVVPGLQTEAQAVVIDYVRPGMPPGTLNVEEACSGMRLMMAFVALGVAMAYVDEKPLWQRIIMVVCCVPVAVFCNTIRVTTTGLLHVLGHEELARGTPHQLLGVATLGLALGLFSLLGYVLGHLFVEDAMEHAGEGGVN